MANLVLNIYIFLYLQCDCQNTDFCHNVSSADRLVVLMRNYDLYFIYLI